MVVLTQLIEPATILTVSVAAVYLIGWSYLGGYFEQIGFLPNSLELPTSHYLEQGSGTVITGWLIVGCVFIGTTAQSSTVGYVFRFLPLLLTSAWGAFLLITSSKFRRHLVVLALAATALIALIGPHMLMMLIPTAPQERIIMAVFIYGLLIYGARIAGGYTGKKAIEGKSYLPLTIQFTWRDAPPLELSEKDLLLILHNHGKYYVVKKEDPAPASPETYIIPDDMVKYVTLRRIHTVKERRPTSLD